MIRLFGKEIRKIFHPKPGSDTPPRLKLTGAELVAVCEQSVFYTAFKKDAASIREKNCKKEMPQMRVCVPRHSVVLRLQNRRLHLDYITQFQSLNYL